MSDDGQIKRIAQTLLKKTKDGSVKWEHLPQEGSSGSRVTYSTSTSTVVISAGALSQESYVFQIYNSDGVVVEELLVSEERNEHLHPVVGELFRLSHRQALDVDEVLSNLMQELEDE
ncbi:hypothetical protein [Herbidospora mongoliensis]|uniref:hypothetical protein n=1 Tax=Herbidospora mongoliensis TaxID=688067 RepID=UPI000834466A|nr:hypothetical protein [Herbidospora mongoliensis]